MKKLFYLLLFLSYIVKGQEFLSNLDRVEFLPVLNSNFKNIVKHESAYYMSLKKENNLLAFREFNFKEGNVVSAITYDNKGFMTNKEEYFYDDLGFINKIKETDIVFGENTTNEIVITNKFNNKNQILSSKSFNTKDNKLVNQKKYSDYSFDGLSYKIEEISLGLANKLNGKNNYKKIMLYNNAKRTKYVNGNTFLSIEYYYNEKGLLIEQKEREKIGKFTYEYDSVGNVIKSTIDWGFFKNITFYKITYNDGTVTGKIK